MFQFIIIFFLFSQTGTKTVPLPPTTKRTKNAKDGNGRNKHIVGYLERSPYVQNVTKTALSFLWETPTYEKCVIKLTSTSNQVEKTITSGPAKSHEVRFTVLSPQTKYKYRLESIQGVWTGQVETAPGNDAPFSFLVFGDNRNGHQAHRDVIKSMTVQPASFFINTGDLTKDGAEKTNYIRFLRIEAPLMVRIPLYPVVGNHENAAVGSGLTNFRKYFALPRNGPDPEFTYSFTWGNSRFIFLDTNKPLVGSAQAKWFREQLRSTAFDNKIRHIFVFVHQSPYTSGPHGPHQGLHEAGMVDDMRRFGVDMIFAAHDHIYERGRVDGLTYIVTGGGGAPTYFIRTHKPYSIIAEATYHYCRLFIDGDTMERYPC
ncbi:metallophosphoesterase [Myxococcota bacterium]|nr:metallophosphoesterase [Myxococcota bacterium]